MAGAIQQVSDVTPLVSVDWLATRLGGANLLVLDIRSAVDGGGAAAFAAAHVPGAVHTDYTKDGWRAARGLVTGLLPAPEALEELFGRLGLRRDVAVVIVGAGNGPGDFSAAARVYWTLRTAGHGPVSILDGGMAAWTQAGDRPVESGPGRMPVPTRYAIVLDRTWHSDLSAVAAAVAKGRAVLLDARAPDFFIGAKKSPQALRAGRLPGALSLDYTAAFAATGRLRPVGDIAAQFSALPAGPVIHYCNTGQQAAANWFIMSELLQRPEATLYDGSMAEWTELPERPVATG